ncbi:hypothetical protein Y032_0087g2034 [Ancylostoma ceylanicum]|uniref:SCP domain-containing protein n=1 Tax=Ancylostoma ceylanicum TaxID=53326 RepID=A0A016TPB8_9BILA|nr:hypothetical protein Y032_0087g2034 [Ancylostoma ceylanicum]
MAKFYFITLAITFLPALCNGSFCRRGKLERSQINDFIINPVNEARRILTSGKQKNGYSGKNMPAAKGMTKLAWSCPLEKAAIEALNGKCTFDKDPVDGNGRATIFQQGYAFGDQIDDGILKIIIRNNLNGINDFTLEGVTPNRVVFKKKTPIGLKGFVDVIRPKATRIGCAWTKCKGEGDPYAVYCVLNAKKLNDGDVVYEA